MPKSVSTLLTLIFYNFAKYLKLSPSHNLHILNAWYNHKAYEEKRTKTSWNTLNKIQAQGPWRVFAFKIITVFQHTTFLAHGEH